jgi:superfamily II DNA or RNA helicase
MLNVHKMIYPAKAARMRIADLGDRFPETQITADLYEIKGWKRQNEAFEKLMEEIKTLQKEAKEGWPSAALTLNMRYRQLTEHLKVDTLTALTNDYLENKKSVAIFVNYTETLFELAKKFPKASLIHGGQIRKGEREAEIQRFQDDKARVIISNIKAGGVGVSLHDLHGRYGRVSLICPTYSAQDLIQAAGRVHRAGGMSKSLQRIIYAKGTVEEEMCRKVATRVASIQALNDGDLREHDIMGFKSPIPFDEGEV